MKKEMGELQIDVVEQLPYAYRCNLYTGDRCATIFISKTDYELLMSDGFFVRDGRNADSAGVLNTTTEWVKKKK